MGSERYLSTAQATRAEQLKRTRKSLGALSEAASKVAKYQEKYVDAVKLFTDCLLDSSDAVEQSRLVFNAEGDTVIAPTFEVTGRLARLFTALRASPELLKIQQDFESLADACTLAKRSAEITAKQTAKVKDCAERCAKDAARARKRGEKHDGSSKARRRKAFSDSLAAEMAELDHADTESIRSLSIWWSRKLSTLSHEITDDASRLGSAAAHLFAPSPATSQQPPVAAPAPPDRGVEVAPDHADPAAALHGAATSTNAEQLDTFPSPQSTSQEVPPPRVESLPNGETGLPAQAQSP